MTKSNPSAFLSQKFKGIKFPFFFLFFSVVFWQCVSPPDFLGGDLLPDGDVFRVKTDTSFQFSVYTSDYDSLNTAQFGTAVVGETFDPIFGRSRASFLSQILLPNANHKWGTNPVIDSVFLYLSLSDKLGNEPIYFGVYELVDSLSLGVGYNGLNSVDNFVGTTEIGATLLPYTGEETVLKIPIDPVWVNNKLIIAAQQDTTIMSSQENFLKHFPGIYVAPKNTFATYAKGMYYFDYTNTASTLSVFYSNDEQDEDATTSLTYSLVFSANGSARFNHFQHDFSVADPELAVKFNSQEGAEQDTVVYVKGLGAARGMIVLDDIYDWASQMPMAINRAELQIELENHEGMPADTLLNQLFLYTLKDGKPADLLDRLYDEENFGGKYRKSKNRYSFNITYHLQSLLNDPEQSKIIYIEPRNGSIRANGAVLRSGVHSSRMKLIITYTKF